MAKKKVVSGSTYIAVADCNDTVVHIGSLDQIAEAITDYCDAEGWDAEEAESSISVYELGERVTFGANTKLEIYF